MKRAPYCTGGHPHLGRRNFLYGLGSSLGSLAFTDLLAREGAGGAIPGQMHRPRAKACIMLFMEGGPSHMDTFDPKPKLNRLHLSESHRTGGLHQGSRHYVGSPFQSRRVGQSGIEMSEHWKHLADPEVADELCVYRGCQAESLNHPEALYHMNTGSRLGSDPAIGSWMTFGLGSENENLPGFVVMTDHALPQGAAGNWSNGFLPAHYQGTRFRSEGSPVLDLNPASFRTRQHQREEVDELNFLNQLHAERHPHHSELASRMENYELAYRMQAEVPEVADLSTESDQTKEMYGFEQKETETFGRQCLMARRLVEKGVRFVQLYSGGWDSHDNLEPGHRKRIQSVDKPIAALIRDLKQRGMLEDTLVMWTGEFGRTPDNMKRGGVTALGRGHNIDAMNMWFAGGGTRRGTVVGATDEIGESAVEVVHPIRDVHVTMLHLMGLDDNKLTYFHGGRYKQLSQFGGEVIPELLA